MPIASPTIRALIAKTLASMPNAGIKRQFVPSADDPSVQVPVLLSEPGGDWLAIAERRWGPHHGINKTAVGAVSSGDIPNARVLDSDFFGSVLQESIIGRMAGLRRVPFATRFLRATETTRGYWVEQFKPIPLSKRAIEGSSLPRRKIGAIIAATVESIQKDGPDAEGRIEADLRAACAATLDAAFIDASNGGIPDVTPASVVYDLGVPSQGDPASDIELLIAGFGGDLSAAYFITDPTTAAQIALARDAGGAFTFSDCSPRGGSILGIPLLTSRGSPRDSNGGQIALVDASGIAAALDSIELSRSTSATLVMSDSPEASGDAGEFVSLFQTGTIGFKAIINGNWELQRDGGAIAVTGVNYPVGSAS